MLGSDMLEVAIGLGFIFGLLALVASAVRESIEALLQMRAVGLERGVRELLDDCGGAGLAGRLYAHPLIAGLYRGRYAPETQLVERRGGRRLAFGSRLPAYLPSRAVALALLDLAAGDGATPDVRTVESGLARIDSRPLRGALAIALGEAQGDFARLVDEVERWFDTAMERVGGWYRKQTQGVLLAIGLALAVLLNVDSLALADALYRGPTLRAALVAEAEKAAPCPGDAAGACGAAQRLAVLDLPIGWAGARRAPWWRSLPGWLLTAFAVALGAPFWFDLLGRVATLRSTVRPGATPPPATAPSPALPSFAPPSSALPTAHQWADRADPQEGLL